MVETKIAYREAKTVYFEKLGPDNTETTLSLAWERAQELGLKTVVVASTRGATGARAVEVFRGMRVIVVSHVHGFREPNTHSLTPANRARIEDLGGTIHIATHILGGIGRAVRRKFNTVGTDELIAYTLRLFGHGMKVACEVSAMAADAGLVRTDQDILAIAGSGRGADTAVVLRPANTQDFFDIKVKEIICKPRL